MSIMFWNASYCDTYIWWTRKKHGLVEKINGYLPITVSPHDPLPKTICETCLRRVEQHYELLSRLEEYRESRLMKKVWVFYVQEY